MKKLFIAMLSLLLMVCICGCGSTPPEEEKEQPEAKDTAWAEEYQKILASPEAIDEGESKYGATVSFVRQQLETEFLFTNYFLHDVDQNGIPELYICQKNQDLMLVANYNGSEAVVSGIFCLTHLNDGTKELLEHGHWQGSGGSGENEWNIFAYDSNAVLTETLHIDYGSPDFEGAVVLDHTTDQKQVDATMDDYRALYDEHVKSATEIAEIKKYDLNDMSAFAEYGVTLKNTSEVNEQAVYNSTLTQIRDAMNGRVVDEEQIPSDLKDTIAFSQDGMVDVSYAMKDLDGNGVEELIIGEGSGDEIQPLGVYTIKDGKAYLFSELCYYYGILSDGTIHTFQGNGVPEGHPDGFFWRVDGTELKEVSDSGAGEMEFAWTPINP